MREPLCTCACARDATVFGGSGCGSWFRLNHKISGPKTCTLGCLVRFLDLDLFDFISSVNFIGLIDLYHYCLHCAVFAVPPSLVVVSNK